MKRRASSMTFIATLVLALWSVGAHAALIADPGEDASSRFVERFEEVDPAELNDEESPTPTASEEALGELDASAANLATIGKALEAYRNDHEGAYPDWLSDLYPKYLDDPNVLICPADPDGGAPFIPANKDPNLPTSYDYELTPSRFESGRMMLRRYGAFAPIIRCWHHLDVPLSVSRGGASSPEDGETVLTLTGDLHVWRTLPEWQQDPWVIEQVFRQMKEAILARDSAKLAGYRFGSLGLLSKDARQEVVGLLEDAASEGVDNGEFYRLLGAYYLTQGETDLARASFEKAVETLKDDAEPRFILGLLYSEAGESGRAMEQLTAGLKLQPDTADIALKIGRLYADRNDKAALTAHYEWFKQAPHRESPEYYYVLGDLAYLAGDYETSRTAFQRVLDLLGKRASLGDSVTTFVIMRLGNIYEKLGKEKTANELRALIDPGIVLVGKQAPSFEAKDANGETYRSAETSGKPIVLNFWASRSPYCRDMIDVLAEMHRTYADKGLVIIGVNQIDPPVDEVVFSTVHVPYRSLFLAKDVFAAYMVRSIPTTLYIDRNGIVRYRQVGFRKEDRPDVERRILAILKED